MCYFCRSSCEFHRRRTQPTTTSTQSQTLNKSMPNRSAPTPSRPTLFPKLTYKARKISSAIHKKQISRVGKMCQRQHIMTKKLTYVETKMADIQEKKQKFQRELRNRQKMLAIQQTVSSICEFWDQRQGRVYLKWSQYWVFLHFLKWGKKFSIPIQKQKI